MASKLEKWARSELQYLKSEIVWLKSGAAWTSPSGDNINDLKMKELEARLEHANQVLGADEV